jgi:hypothetical protein
VDRLGAQEPEHPAFGPHQVIQLTITVDALDVAGKPGVPDIAKIETKAVAILRAWDPSITLVDARAKVRVDGRTDVARCMEYIAIDRLNGISQAKVVGVRQEVQHPVVEQP